MSWPPTTGFSHHGAEPAIVAWGTDGILVSNVAGANLTNVGAGTFNVIVKNIRSMQMAEEVKIENGTGLTATQIILIDGNQVELTVVDDRNMIFPTVDQIIALIDPITESGFPSVRTFFRVVSNDYNAARKQEGDRVMLAKVYTLIPVPDP